MDIKIGVKEVGRELTLDIEGSAEELIHKIQSSLKDGEPIDLTDKKGSRYLIPDDTFAYLEISAVENHRVGFGI